MPWHAGFYPAAMNRLPAATRAKAVEIANALLDQGYDEGKAIRIAIAKARRWAAARSAKDVGARFEVVDWNSDL